MTSASGPTRKLSKNGHDFIQDEEIEALLGHPVDPRQVRDIVAKSMAKEPLKVAETAVLLNATDPELVETIFDAARQLKRDVYGNRIVYLPRCTSATNAPTNVNTADFEHPTSRRFAEHSIVTN